MITVNETPNPSAPSAGALRLVNVGGTFYVLDPNGTLTAVVVGDITSADITDATDDGRTNVGKVLKTDDSGGLILQTLETVGDIETNRVNADGMRLYDTESGKYVQFSALALLTNNRNYTVRDAPGSLAVGSTVLKISDPSGGSTTDAEARTAINAIIDALEAFGISSAS